MPRGTWCQRTTSGSRISWWPASPSTRWKACTWMRPSCRARTCGCCSKRAAGCAPSRGRGLLLRRLCVPPLDLGFVLFVERQDRLRDAIGGPFGRPLHLELQLLLGDATHLVGRVLPPQQLFDPALEV